MNPAFSCRWQPTRTFSSTSMFSKMRRFWKVRAIPRRALAAGDIGTACNLLGDADRRAAFGAAARERAIVEFGYDGLARRLQAALDAA